MEENGLADIWLNQFNIEIPIANIKQRILDIYKQSWYSDINNSARLKSYYFFKHEFDVEKYLDLNIEHKYIRCLTQFRLSSHKLNVEVGRYTRTPRELRLCKSCTMQTIESEYHFLLVCPKYRELHQKYLKPYFCRWLTLQKFKTIVSSKQEKAG